MSCQRDLFSLPAGCHYLNSAYMSPLSKRVQDAGIAGVLRKAVPAEIRSEDFFTDLSGVCLVHPEDLGHLFRLALKRKSQNRTRL
jgi:hypothetical protein